MWRLVFVALIIAGCGSRTEAGSAASQTATPSAIPSPSPSPSASPRRVPGSAVRVSVNGVEQTPNAALPGPLSGPLTLRLTFPFDMDRASFERFLPTTVKPTWLDDRTVDLLVPQGTPAFKAVELPSHDGTAVIDIVFVTVLFPPSRVVNVYTVADLTAARPPAPDAPAIPHPSNSDRVHLPAQRGFVAGLSLSRDAKTMLVYGTPSATQGVQLVDVASDSARALTDVPAADGPFVFGDWLSDGRLFIVGKSAWIGNGDGTAMRHLADLSSSNGRPDTIVVSPDARRAAVSYRGRVFTFDLDSGALHALTDAFRPCAGSTITAMSWSLDGKRLAGVDCTPGTAAETAQVRIFDLPTTSVVATISGGAYSVATFPTGELLVVRPSGIVGEGAPSLGVVLSFDGIERQRFTGGNWQLSPDARYLLQLEPVGGAGSELGTTFTLIEQRTAARYRLFLPWGVRWLPDGRLAGF